VVASAVGRMVEPEPPIGQVVSPTITLVDEGIRQGWSVTLPNDGGQFTNDFDQQYLQVQAVGQDPTAVRAKVQSLVHRIDSALTMLQDRAQVPVVNRITTVENPSVIQVYYDGPSRMRAVGAVLVLGFGATMAAEMLLRRWRDRFHTISTPVVAA
jgi:hypothetical protein